MGNFWAVFKRELKVYFASPIAYAAITIFLIISGYFFFSTVSYYALATFQAMQNPRMMQTLTVADMVIRPLFSNMGVIMLMMMPTITMRLFAEEKKSGTFELLFTFPIRDIEVLLGKYFAALAFFTVMLALTGFYILILFFLGKSDPGVVLSCYLGLFLMGAAFIALGILISALTENQIVAAVVSFGLLLLLWVIGWATSLVGPTLGPVFEHISLVQHYQNFTKGVVETSDVVFYLSFIFFFIFMTLRVLESKRWRG